MEPPHLIGQPMYNVTCLPPSDSNIPVTNSPETIPTFYGTLEVQHIDALN